jgi:hypothetical protein
MPVGAWELIQNRLMNSYRPQLCLLLASSFAVLFLPPLRALSYLAVLPTNHSEHATWGSVSGNSLACSLEVDGFMAIHRLVYACLCIHIACPNVL